MSLIRKVRKAIIKRKKSKALSVFQGVLNDLMSFIEDARKEIDKRRQAQARREKQIADFASKKHEQNEADEEAISELDEEIREASEVVDRLRLLTGDD